MKRLVPFLTFCLCASLFWSNVAWAGESKIKISVPGTPSSLPVIIAAKEFGEVKIVHNRAQAHAGFLRGDADILLTGLSVGLKFFEQGKQVKVLASHVSSLSYLVYNTGNISAVNSFADLKGKKLWLPFPGSPLEEITAYFASQEGVELGEDIEPGYSDFQSSVKRLQLGKIDVAALPEPFVSLALKDSRVKVGIDFSKLYQKYNSVDYPQVVLLGKKEWLEKNTTLLKQFKEELAKAIKLCQEKPEQAIKLARGTYSFPDEVLRQSLTRTRFSLQYDKELEETVYTYYKNIGKELDGKYSELFQIDN